MDVSPLQNLVELDISGSGIENIPVLLTTCQSLETVKLDRCPLLRFQPGRKRCVEDAAAFEESGNQP